MASTKDREQGFDRDVLAAVDEVDDSLLEWSLSLSPRERLRACASLVNTVARLRERTKVSAGD